MEGKSAEMHNVAGDEYMQIQKKKNILLFITIYLDEWTSANLTLNSRVYVCSKSVSADNLESF